MALFSIILSILAVFLAALYLYYKYMFRFWKKLGVKHTEPAFPLGDLSGVGRKANMGELVTKVYNEFPNERFVGMWFLFQPGLLIRDPELVKTVFVRDFMNFHDRGVELNEKDDPLSAHLFSISGTRWRNLRVKLSPTFTSGKMKMMFPILVECCKQLTSVLDEMAKRGEVVDVKEYAARFTTDIISLCAFGIDTDTLHRPDNEFRHYGKKIFEPSVIQIIRGFFLAVAPKVATFLGVVQTPPEVTVFFLKALRESIDYRKNNKIRRNDFLDLLIQLMDKGRLEDVDHDDNKEQQKFTFEEAAAQAFVFFVAGFETSSTTMQFCLYELALNPDIQKKTRDEINAVLEKHNGQLTYDCISQMDYLSRVIDETLRVFPPVPFLQRQCNKDYKIPDTDVIIPKDLVVFIDVLGMHRDPRHFPQPEKFDPDRFTEEEKAKRHHYAYLPFGEGPRNCIGMRFGLMQTKVGLITLLTNYEFSVANETLIPMALDPMTFILSPQGGMKLKMTKLEQ